MLFKTDDFPTLLLQIVAVALAITILVTGGGMLAWHLYVGRMTEMNYDPNGGIGVGEGTIAEDDKDRVGDQEELPQVLEDTPEPGEVPEGEEIVPSELNSLKANIKSWVRNGTPIRDDNVTNILLIGMENQENDNDLSKNGRADAMVLLSLNHNTKTITLASLLRDQYSYIIDGNKGRFTKLHHALKYDGPTLQIQMVENYYKVIVDNYAIVNFTSLPKIIDAIGGVTVDVTNAEADFLNSECGFHISSGENTFVGEHALVYMRIRKGNTGGDVGRTGRQRKVITALIDKAKTMGTSELIPIVNEMIPNVRTGLTSTEILAYVINALEQGWINYEIKQIVLPDDDCATGFTVREIYEGSPTNIWYWKVDFPVAARKLQIALYGDSSIELKNHKSWLKS